MVWELRGTDSQNALVQQALDRTTFPFDELLPGLQNTVGRSVIPVEWEDLSRYTAMMQEAKEHGKHLHVHEDGDTGHPVERRDRVLGLAWYSGKVTLDITMESDPELAQEVFLSEGAHMIDFFWMEDRHRAAIWNALHAVHQDIPPETKIEDAIDLGHGHGWFDVGDYYSWLGEAWMGLFVKSYSNVDVTIPFDHPVTPEAITEVRGALTPYFGLDGSHIYHDSHRMTTRRYIGFFAHAPEDREPCSVCKPR